MAVDHELRQQGTALLDPKRRRGVSLRRRRLPSIRLGGKGRRGVASAVGLLRRIQLRWLRLRYARLLRRVTELYRDMKKDLAVAGASLDTFQKRVLMEASFAVPVMGLAFSGYPGAAAGTDHRPRTLVM